MSRVVALGVSYQAAKPSPDYTRLGKVSTPAYIWGKLGSADAITDIEVLYDDESPSEGFTKIDTDLNKGKADAQVYLSYRRGEKDLPPIIDLKVIDSEDAAGEGYKRVEKDLNRSGRAQKFLCYKTEGPGKEIKFEIGMTVDVLDSISKWCVGDIVKTRDGEAYVHYRGWSDKWNEWVRTNSERLAPLRTYTTGDTGAQPKDPMEIWRCEGGNYEQFLKFHKRLKEALVHQSAENRSLQEQAFLVDRLPSMVVNVLKASVDDPKHITQLVEFLVATLDLVLVTLQKDDEIPSIFFKFVIWIFGTLDERFVRFYQKYGTSKDEASYDGKFCTRKSASRNRSEPMSVYLVQMINHFGEHGGFEAMLKRAVNKKSDDDLEPIALPTLSFVVRVMSYSHDMLERSFIREFYPRVKDAMFSRLEGLTDAELKTLDKGSLHTITTDTCKLLGQVSNNADQACEEFRLKMVIRLLKCPSLERRINGISDLHKIIESVEKKEQHSYSYSHSDPPPAKYLSAKLLLKWITEQDLVKMLLMTNSHVQLISRTPAIFRFMAKYKGLTVDHLNMLWDASLDKHESIVRAIYEAIIQMTSAKFRELTVVHVDVLQARIEELPISEYNELTLRFIHLFTLQAIQMSSEKRGSDPKPYGLELMWQVIVDDSPLSEELVTNAQNDLIEQLREHDCFREKFLMRCIANLKTHVSVCQSVYILQEVIRHFPEYRRHRGREPTQEHVVTSLLKKKDLLDLLYTGLKKYRDAALAALPKVTSPANIDQRVLVGRHPHAAQVDTRLQFLQYVYRTSDQPLDKESFDILWDTLVANPVSKLKDCDLLMQWLRTLQQQSKSSLTPETSLYIFQEYLSDAKKLNYENMTPLMYACFETFCRQVNAHDKRIQGAHSQDFLILKYPLVGLDSLWEICANVRNNNVFIPAASLLRGFHVKLLDPYNATDTDEGVDRQAVTNAFLDRSNKLLSSYMEEVKKLKPGPEKDIKRRSIIRILDIVERFVANVDEFMMRTTFHGHQLQVHLVTVVKKKEKVSRHTFELKERDLPLVEIRNSIAKHWKCEPRVIRLESNGRILYASDCDDCSCQELYVSDPLVARRLTEEEAVIDAEKRTEEFEVRFILSNTAKHFELLFSLLDLGSDIAERVWKLLNSLPHNQALQEAVLDHNAWPAKPDFATMFFVSSPPKLLYTLRVVWHILENDPKEWLERFLSAGGFKFLYDVFMGFDQDVMFSNDLTVQCLRTVLFHILWIVQRDTAQLLKVANLTKLTKRLLDCIHRSANYAMDAKPPRSEKENTPRGRGRRHKYGGEMDEKDERTFEDDRYPKSRFDRHRNTPPSSHRSQPPQSSVHGEVVAECVGLLRMCLEAGNTEQLKIVFEFPQLSDVIMSGLLKNSGQHLREELSKGITALCEIETPYKGRRVLDVMISALLGCLFQIDTRSPHCLEYFSLIQDLLSGSIDTSSLDTAHIIPQIVKKIREHPIIERRATDNDYVLRGLLTLCSALIDQKSLEIIRKSSDESLVREIFINCLFKLPSSKARIQPPKCKSKETRRAAFNFLIKLVKDSPHQLRELLQLMIPYHGRTKAAITAKDWEFLSVHEEKSETGYVGIKNLGCICYMNSFFQQIFMMPQLRKDILAVQDTSEVKSESVLYQLQHILGFLQESEKQYCDPAGFCHAFKDFEGNPTNVSVQMDANEFVNFLFDRVDTLLKDTPAAKVLQNHMGGQLVQQVIGKTCPHTSERFEPFYLLTLHIRNKKNIKESLEAFVEGDMLEGDNAYQCSKCDKKVDAVKRSCLGKLPPTLVLHLSRFEFDFDAMAKVKLNDRCEFPIELDMRPYTAEGLAEKEKKAEGKNTDAASDESSVSGGLKSPPSKKSKSSKEKTPKKTPPRKSGAEGKDDDAKSEEDDKEEEVVFHPDSYYKYRLVGVLVHMGSANGGHYYSFIKERQGGVGGTGTGRQGGGGPDDDLGVWNEYNDIHVHPFDPRTLADETFGGEEVYAHMGTAHEKRRNAYMLFYERVEQDLDDDGDVEGKELKDEKEESAVERVPSTSRSSGQTSSKEKEVSFYGAAATAKAAKQLKSFSDKVQSRKVPVPPEIFNEIWEENINYWRNTWVFNLEYFKFVCNIMGSLSFEEDRSLPLTSLPDPRVSLDMAAAQLLSRFVFETYSRSHFKDDPRHASVPAAQVDVWMKKLRQVYKSSIPACIWLLEELSDPGNFWLKSLIIDQRNEALRSNVARLIVQIIDVVLPLEAESRDNPLLFKPVRTTPRPQVKATALNSSAVHSDSSSDEYVVVEHSDVDDTAPREPLTYRVMVRLFSHISEAYPVWDRFHHYFEIFSKYAQSGPPQARRLLNLGVVRHFVDFWLADASPQQIYVKPRLNSRGMRRRHGDSYNRADFHFLLRCLSYVVRSASVGRATLKASSSSSTLFHESHPSLPSHAKTTAGAAYPAAPEMCDADRDMVQHDRNRDKMLLECINQAHGNSVSAIICHFCWEDFQYTETLVAQMIHLVEETDSGYIRRYFRVLTPMLALEDSLQAKRVDLILSQLLAIMETQRGYYRATEMCVEHVIRIARQNDVARQWLSVAEHAEQLSWMIDYFTKYTRPPTYNDNSVRLNKHREHDWRSGHTQRVYGLPAEDKVAALEALQEGRDDLTPLSDVDSEPDYSERTFAKGQDVDCLDQVKKWCKARITDTNKEENLVFLHYDGWNDKWDEWISCDSPRLIEAGRKVPREGATSASEKKGSSVASSDSPAKSSGGDSRPRSPVPQSSMSSVSSTTSTSTSASSRPTSAQKGAESGAVQKFSQSSRPQSAPSRASMSSQIADGAKSGTKPMNSKQQSAKAVQQPSADAAAADHQGSATANSPTTPKSGGTDKENVANKKAASAGGSRRSSSRSASSRSSSKNEKKKSKARTQGDSGSTQPSRGFRNPFSKNK